MSKIRIFQFPIRNSNGGVTHYAMNNWNYLDKSRFQCDFGTVSKHLDFADEIKASGAGLRYISCYAEENPEQFAKEMRKVLQDGHYDILHLHTSFWKSFLVEEIAQECGIKKVIVHAHSTKIDIQDRALRIAAEEIHQLKKQAFTASMATDFWACSRAAADFLFGPQIPREKIVIMNNAIDVQAFAFNPSIRERYRRQLGIEDSLVVGTVGRLCYQKNQGFLLNVFANVYHKQKNARLLLIGAGELEEDLRQQAEKLNIAEAVLFLGQRADILQLLQAMDVFCLPSRFEGLGLVLVEAQAAGLKCLASDAVPGEARLTENIAFLPLDEPLWTNQILETAKGYSRENMYDAITEAGYNIEQQIKEIEQLYLD